MKIDLDLDQLCAMRDGLPDQIAAVRKLAEIASDERDLACGEWQAAQWQPAVDARWLAAERRHDALRNMTFSITSLHDQINNICDDLATLAKLDADDAATTAAKGEA